MPPTLRHAAAADASPEPDRRMGGWTGIGYDDIGTGERFAAQPLSIDADALVRFRACLGEAPAPVANGDRIPAFLLNEIKVLKSRMRFPPGVLHAQEEIEMHSVARFGEPLVTEVAITDKYIRNQKRFIVAEQHVSCATDRRPVATIKHVLYWPC